MHSAHRRRLGFRVLLLSVDRIASKLSRHRGQDRPRRAISVPVEVAGPDGDVERRNAGRVGERARRAEAVRRIRQDEADIVALIKTGRVDLSGFPLPAEIMSAFRELVEAAATDLHPP